MQTAAQLREKLHSAKEQFDGEVFGICRMPQEQRLARWNAFLKDAAPLVQELRKAERYESRVGIRQAVDHNLHARAILSP